MEQAFQIAGIAIVTALACCAIGGRSEVLSAVLSIAACVILLLLSFEFLTPIIDVFERLKTMTGISGAVMAPVMKAAGVGILVQIAATVCEDAGENTLRKSVEIAGAFLALYVSLPLLSSVLNLLEELLRK